MLFKLQGPGDSDFQWRLLDIRMLVGEPNYNSLSYPSYIAKLQTSRKACHLLSFT